ncbi:MAG: RIP metalloprotease RseP [Sphingomonadales bacterium]
MSALFSILMFILVFTILVFVHELGHFWVARRNNIRIDVFSIGFGPEIFGWTDGSGTRWKISWIPLGGYVKFFGDENAASMPGDAVDELTDEEKEVSFHHKSLARRAAVVAAGPISNLLFAIIVFAGMFAIVGQPFLAAQVKNIAPDSAAESAGFVAGDLIVRIGDEEIKRFEDVKDIVDDSPGRTLDIFVLRDGAEVKLTAVPDIVRYTDNFGKPHEGGRLGIEAEGYEIRERGPLEAVWYGTAETGRYIKLILRYLGQIIVGTRSAEELGGPLMIAKMSGQAAEAGPGNLIVFVALLSINLGLLNLFPIPMLDGGHLLFYAFEGIRGKPLGERAQEYGVRIGLAAVLTLTVFVTWQDLLKLKVFNYFSDLFS